MHLIPSLLEYSPAKLKAKLNLIQGKYKQFLELTTQPKDSLDLHLDFVLDQFAKDRSVMASLGLEAVLTELEDRFSSNKLTLSIHLMGSLEDMRLANEFLQGYTFNPSWSYQIYIDPDLIPTFRVHELLFENVELGIWYDPNDWSDSSTVIPSQSINNYLLMTVVAGKSGQSKSLESVESIIQISKTHPKINFIADGGWKVQDMLEIKTKQNLQNLKIVSYSSFWQEMGL